MNVCVIIPAAGRGTRFGPSDKLSQEVGGRPLLMRTVELFTKRDEVRSIIVAGPPEALEDFKNRYGPHSAFTGPPSCKAVGWGAGKPSATHLRLCPKAPPESPCTTPPEQL